MDLLLVEASILGHGTWSKSKQHISLYRSAVAIFHDVVQPVFARPVIKLVCQFCVNFPILEVTGTQKDQGNGKGKYLEKIAQIRGMSSEKKKKKYRAMMLEIVHHNELLENRMAFFIVIYDEQ